ncbi:hypothetical protein N5C81_15130 [Rhizobium pusense]|uniref:hypothetical protein n=1 Tax=Agrobacterium pusense TaxID=648995 RepID=UPI00244D1BB9|nr:hypothetical protein [Agrobacterium pusense]MDH1268957.1 hypothetical protein [Agrobacterium pusense]
MSWCILAIERDGPVILDVELRRFETARALGVYLPVRRVPFVVATLAEGAATLWIGVCLVVIHVGNRQNNLAAGLWMSFTVHGSALWMLWSSFAAVSGSFQE